MAYTEEILSRARARLAQQRDSYEQTQAIRSRQIYERYPRLKEIDLRLRATVAEAMNAAFRTGADPTETLSRLKEENLSLQEERAELLHKADLSSDCMDPAPLCPLCNGTGYRGAVMCSCLQELCRQEQEKDLSTLLETGPADFSAFSLQYYSPRIDPAYGISPRESMQIVFDEARSWAENFSEDSASLLFSGGTGLGKTSLSACIAKSVSEKGYSIVYDTAVHMFSAFEAEKFRTSQESLTGGTEKYFQCDLLIVDDLGTEMTTQFTISVLYTVVNTRLMNRRPAIISTNLKMDEIQRRYTPQIVSRLEGAYRTLPFVGSDIRLIRRDEA